MRILHVAHAFPPESYAGVEVHTLGVCRELAARGHDVAVLHRAGDGDPWQVTAAEFEGLKTFRLTNPLPYDSIDSSFHDERVEPGFREVIERFRPEVIHFQHLIHLSAHLPAVARDLGIPSLLTFHDYWYLCSRVQLYRPGEGPCAGPKTLRCARCLGGQVHLPRWLEGPADWVGRRKGWSEARVQRLGEPVMIGHVVRRRAQLSEWLAAPALLIANSDHLRQRYLESLEVRAERIRVVRYGLDPAPFRNLPSRTPSPDKLRLGYTGSLVEHKGLHLLLEAIAPLEGLRLDVFGAHEGDPAVKAYFEALPRLPNVRFHGGYRQREVGQLLTRVDVLVVPSIWEEAWGLIVDEAFLTGVPVIASRAGGLPEHVHAGQNGLLFRAGDAGDLRRQIQRLLQKRSLLEKLRAGIGPVRTLTSNVDELEVLYGAAAAGEIETRRSESLWDRIREKRRQRRSRQPEAEADRR